ncbi:MAG TPA: Ig-like domain-containing protein [Flavisolibacter sp.]|nr:Ig-like domain-containing protein [Flavisolibacter sp.]
MKKIVAFIVIFIFVVTSIFTGTGCANIIPPTGGPRDSTPPTLVSATPRDSTTNFRADRIVLTFDEYISLQDVSSNLLFTPTFDINPEIAERGKTITIRFRDSLSPNTTYIFNFGNAIRDVNESNTLQGFTYTFSTGAALDSLELTGKVLVAHTGAVDSTLIVMLHRNLTDSAVVNSRPTYVTRLDREGNFRFKNLPSGSFAIYALGDAGFSRRYQNKNQLFAFADSVVRPGVTKDITLYAFRETTPQTTPAADTRIPAGAERRLQFTTNLNNNRQELRSDLILNFLTPLRVFDTTQVALTRDSVFTPVRYSASIDSARKQVIFKTAWVEGTNYNLVLNRNFAEDTAGRKLLKTDTLEFTTKKATDYGKLTIRVRNVNAALNPVLQLLQNDQVIFSASAKTGIITQELFAPGEYSVRIFFDRNGNGRWDSGDFFRERRQPEIVRPVERKFSVKPAWDNEFEISL